MSSRTILILSSHLCLGLPKGLFPVGLPVLKSWKHSHLPPKLTTTIHKTVSASTPKRQPAKQLWLSISSTMLANIWGKNRLRWERQNDGTLPPRIESVSWKGALLSSSRMEELSMRWMLKSLNPEDLSLWKMTKQVMMLPDINPPLQVPFQAPTRPTSWQTT